MKTIVLIGMMGCGKTTTAKILGNRYNLTAIDIDEIIVQNEKSSICEIFSKKGESYFREIEKSTILNYISSENQIVSLGGGAFENCETQEFLLKNTCVIFLNANAETILNRIKDDTVARPLLNGNMNREQINTLINKRISNYQKAHYTINTNNKPAKEVAKEITEILDNG